MSEIQVEMGLKQDNIDAAIAYSKEPPAIVNRHFSAMSVIYDAKKEFMKVVHTPEEVDAFDIQAMIKILTSPDVKHNKAFGDGRDIISVQESNHFPINLIPSGNPALLDAALAKIQEERNMQANQFAVATGHVLRDGKLVPLDITPEQALKVRDELVIRNPEIRKAVDMHEGLEQKFMAEDDVNDSNHLTSDHKKALQKVDENIMVQIMTKGAETVPGVHASYSEQLDIERKQRYQDAHTQSFNLQQQQELQYR